MALNLEAKKAIVNDLATKVEEAVMVIAAEYRGLSVSSMTTLRRKARDAGLHIQVVRNTLARRAFIGTDFECLNETLLGPLVLVFAPEDPGVAARVVRDFVKENELLVVKNLAMAGQLFEPSKLKAVASLPTRDEAIAQLMSVMLAPVSQFVRTLAEPTAKFVRTLAAVRDQKQAA